MISSERASQEEQNSANFSSVAHSMKELHIVKWRQMYKSENFDFGQKGNHMKEHLKRNRMAQISAS